jgi:putative ABC transport system permease protein
MFAFCMLRTLVAAWYAGVDASGPDRLVTRNKISLIYSLPLSYKARIHQVSGVKAVGHGLWYAGIYKDKKNFFAQFAVGGSQYLDLYPEFILADSDKKAFDRDRKGCIAGRKLANRFGWKVGDVIPFQGTAYPGNIELTLTAIYRGARPTTDETCFFFHFDFLNELMKKTAPERANKTGWYLVQIHEPARAAEVSQEIDAIFVNSLAETLTETEKAFQAGFVAMTDAIVTSIRIISVVVIAVILMVMANTMAMTARERSAEYALFRTLGFGDWFLWRLIAGESLLIASAGGLAGVALSYPGGVIFHPMVEAFLPVFQLEASTAGLALAASVGVGFIAAIPPGIRVSRMGIVEGMGHVG